MSNYLRKTYSIIAMVLSISLLISCNTSVSNNTNETKETASASSEKTYHGVSLGYNGNIEVDVIMDNDIIKDIIVTSEKETPGIGGPLTDNKGNAIKVGGESPITLVPKMIVDNQSINVDAVSGATATSYGILHAVSDALIKANYRVDAVSAATEVVSPDYKPAEVNLSDEERVLLNKWLIKANYETYRENINSDVVVIGGGGAGLAAAISASENGAKVVVIEKNGEVGGDTLVCGAIYNAPNTDLQKQIEMNNIKEEVVEKALSETPVNEEHKELIDTVKTQLEEHKKNNPSELFDSKEWYALQTFNGGDKKANLSLVKTLCFNSYDCLNWIKNIGVSFYDYISQGAGSLWERTHTNKSPMGTGFISNYLKKIESDNNIQIVTNTTATAIEKKDSDRVNVVKCVDKYGNEFEVTANKGVIIATGGFSANASMIDLYNNENSKWKDIALKDIPTTNRKTVSNGSGIEMGASVGADTVDMSEIQLLYLGNLADGQLTKYPPRCVNGTDQVIFINKNGERFTNEGGRRDDICKAILNEPDKMFYILESGDGDKYIDIHSEDFKSADGFSLKYLEENNYIYIGETLDELAEKLNMDVNVLKNTIDEFNSCVDGKTDKYGRTLFSTKLEKGPYVATPRQVSVHHTMGGLKIDEKAHVLDKNGEVIKGLYATGEVTGGIHGGNRLGGNAVVDTVVFGKIAGGNAATE